MIKKLATTGRFKIGQSGSSFFCEDGAVAGSLIVNDQINARNAMHNNMIGSIETGIISSKAPIPNTPTMKPTDPHFLTFP